MEITILVVLFISSYVITKSPAEIYLGYVGIIFFIAYLMPKYGMTKELFFIFLVLAISGLIKLGLGLNETNQFVKVYLGVLFSYLFFYYAFRYYEFNSSVLFKLYLKAAYWVSILGIVQIIGYLFGISFLTTLGGFFNKWGVIYGGNLGIRMNSVFPEPTYYASFMVAAAFVAIRNLLSIGEAYFYNRTKSLIVVGAYLLTFSGSAYLGIFAIGIVLLINFGFIRYAIIFIPLGYFLFNILYYNVDEFRARFDGSTQTFGEGDFRVGVTHGSSIILYNNYHVAIENFKENPLFGTGLGSHPTAFRKHSLTKEFDHTGISMNFQDASSMLLRLISETGLFGTGIFLYITFAFFIVRNKNFDDEFWIISGAVLVTIVLNLARQGHYFLNGFPFYIWLYYYNWKNYKAKRLELRQKPVSNELLKESFT